MGQCRVHGPRLNAPVWKDVDAAVWVGDSVQLELLLELVGFGALRFWCFTTFRLLGFGFRVYRFIGLIAFIRL